MTSEASPPKGAKGEKFLKKAEREQCWKAKDAFWKCMEVNHDNSDLCANNRQMFVQNCPPTWVTHFDRKYQYEKFKAEAAKMGYQKLDEEFANNNSNKK